MWPGSLLTRMLGIKYPIIQAPMSGGITTPELVAAVANSGGLGFLAGGYLDANEIRKLIRQTKGLTSQPFGVNLFIPSKHHASLETIQEACRIIEQCCFELKIPIEPVKGPFIPDFEEQMQVILDEDIHVLSFTFGCLSKPWIEKLKAQKILLIGTATTLDEAKLLQKEGIDMVVVQGCEAGGHRGSFLTREEEALQSIDTLTQQLAKEINVPLIASGGLMRGKDIARMLKLGVSAVQLGTAFLCCDESGAHPKYKEALLNSKQDNTVLTRAFSGKLARGLCNKFILRMQHHEKHILDYPIQNALTLAMRKKAQADNCSDFMSMWAGQSVQFSRKMKAHLLINELIKEVEEAHSQ
ncbi:NAD(P)H-dependent flavin oxidoreductase [Legionella cardiaca]|uniref:Propionate 3-nitronate monooxygenase n=1 Tax=Legionella cardiaca TaxID=1071983 RepID=A0ABY8AU41_9GAMM|nr:nitronate monooxygenase [Legionella cardiaca]WED43291.1 nitronate monooxygenase [Legionella cardiaca]